MTLNKDRIKPPRSKFGEWYYWKVKNKFDYAYPEYVRWRTIIFQTKFWAKRFQELHLGTMVIGKIQFLINLTILLKVFDAPVWLYVIGLFVSAFMLWYIGRFLEKKGFRKHFRDAEFKDVHLK